MSRISKLGTAALISVTALALSACTVRITRVELNCGIGSSGTECEGTIGGEVTPEKSVFGLDVENFNVSFVRFAYDQSYNNLVSDYGSATVTMRAPDGMAIASSAFNWAKHPNGIVFATPSLVDSWVRQYGANARSFEVSFSGIDVDQHNGSNLVVLELIYDTAVQGGASYSWYHSGGGGWTPPQQMN